uniref:Integron gene cassette protein n=1 Tax=Mesocestoides corti TaxID=53468 RepID=A0A5K3FFA6_MESCO
SLLLDPLGSQATSVSSQPKVYPFKRILGIPRANFPSRPLPSATFRACWICSAPARNWVRACRLRYVTLQDPVALMQGVRMGLAIPCAALMAHRQLKSAKRSGRAFLPPP